MDPTPPAGQTPPVQPPAQPDPSLATAATKPRVVVKPVVAPPAPPTPAPPTPATKTDTKEVSLIVNGDKLQGSVKSSDLGFKPDSVAELPPGVSFEGSGADRVVKFDVPKSTTEVKLRGQNTNGEDLEVTVKLKSGPGWLGYLFNPNSSHVAKAIWGGIIAILAFIFGKKSGG